MTGVAIAMTFAGALTVCAPLMPFPAPEPKEIFVNMLCNEEFIQNGDEKWENVGSDDELKALLLETAGCLGTAEALPAWLSARGFTDIKTISNIANRVSVEARWDSEQTGQKLPYRQSILSLRNLLGGDGPYFVSVTFIDGQPKLSTAGFNLN